MCGFFIVTPPCVPPLSYDTWHITYDKSLMIYHLWHIMRPMTWHISPDILCIFKLWSTCRMIISNTWLRGIFQSCSVPFFHSYSSLCFSPVFRLTLMLPFCFVVFFSVFLPAYSSLVPHQFWSSKNFHFFSRPRKQQQYYYPTNFWVVVRCCNYNKHQSKTILACVIVVPHQNHNAWNW